MITFPKAKINFGLRVVSRRDDNFHNIETIFYPLNFSDALEYIVAGKDATDDELTVTGIKIPARRQNNLVTEAVKKLRSRYDIPFLKIHLHKVIPSGAGLGGGSSDASYMLQSVNRFFNLSIPEEELCSIAESIGSDCPFFLTSMPASATGKGEILTPLPSFLNGYYIVLAYPGIQISTKEAYINCFPHNTERSLSSIAAGDPELWRSSVINDFENFVFGIYPVIGDIKESFYHSGAIYSSMTGSGSSVYGIYKEKPHLPELIERYKIFEGLL